jgi:hypothetical protein
VVWPPRRRGTQKVSEPQKLTHATCLNDAIR